MGGAVSGSAGDREPPPTAVLETSRDGAALERAGRSLAHSADPAHVAVLGSFLRRRELLDRLDSSETYLRDADNLRVGRIVELLPRSPSRAAAVSELARLGRDPVFAERLERIEVLLAAGADLRPLPSELVPVFRDHIVPDGGLTNLAVRLLAENGSRPALELLGEALLDSRHSPATRRAWLGNRCLPRRLDPGMIALGRELLAQCGEADFRRDAIDAWFDYHPSGRHMHEEGPPPLSEASAEALRRYVELATLAAADDACDGALRAAVDGAAQAAKRELRERARARPTP